MAEEQPLPDDPERLIARAIESVLESVPDVAGGEATEVESSPKSQPWAETAAPPGRNKRSLDDLLAEYAARVAANPDARATLPDEPHPSQQYLDRLTGGGGGRRGGKRRWRGGRRRRGGGKAGGGKAAGGGSRGGR